jgi:hypothetical protein
MIRLLSACVKLHYPDGDPSLYRSRRRCVDEIQERRVRSLSCVGFASDTALHWWLGVIVTRASALRHTFLIHC